MSREPIETVRLLGKAATEADKRQAAAEIEEHWRRVRPQYRLRAESYRLTENGKLQELVRVYEWNRWLDLKWRVVSTFQRIFSLHRLFGRCSS